MQQHITNYAWYIMIIYYHAFRSSLLMFEEQKILLDLILPNII